MSDLALTALRTVIEWMEMQRREWMTNHMKMWYYLTRRQRRRPRFAARIARQQMAFSLYTAKEAADFAARNLRQIIERINRKRAQREVLLEGSEESFIASLRRHMRYQPYFLP